MSKVCFNCGKKIKVFNESFFNENSNLICKDCKTQVDNEYKEEEQRIKTELITKLEERNRKLQYQQLYDKYNTYIEEKLMHTDDTSIDSILIWLAYNFDDDNWELDKYINPLIDALKNSELTFEFFDNYHDTISNILRLNDDNLSLVYTEEGKHWSFNHAKFYCLAKWILIFYNNEISLVHFISDDPIVVQADKGNAFQDYDRISINGDFYYMKEHYWKKLKEYYAYINQISKEKSERLNFELLEIINNFSDEIKQLAYNFIDVVDNNIFLMRDILTGFEHIISYDENLVKYYCFSSKEERENFMQISQKDDSNFNVLYNIRNDGFQKFKSIIKKRANIEDIYLTSVCWIVLRDQAIKYFYDKWENNYPNLFSAKLLENKNLDDIVRNYFAIDYISHTNITTASCFTYFLMQNSVFEENNNFMICNSALIDVILKIDEEVETQRLEKNLVGKESSADERTISINDVDIMNGYEFESFVCAMFTKLGYKSSVTKSSGDQGLDVIAEKDNTRLGIQAKCYSNKVNNKAVQEIVGALAHYKCDKGIVVTNHYFTESAKELAKSNNVVLWDRDILKNKIIDLYS